MLRLPSISEPLWLDELHTAWTVMAPSATEMSQRAELGNNSSSYFFLVRAITRFLSPSESSLRLLSIISGMLLIPITWAVCRKWGCGGPSSLLAAALLAIDRHATFYACEARPYAFLQILALLHLGLATAILRGERRVSVWLAWTLTGMAMFEIHCTAGLFLAAECLAIAWLVVRRHTNASLQRLCVAYAGIALAMASRLELLGTLAQRRENWSHFIHATQQPLRMLRLFPLQIYVYAPLVLGVGWLLWKRKIRSKNTPQPDREMASNDGSRSTWQFRRVADSLLRSMLDGSEWESIAPQHFKIPITLCIACFVLPVSAAWVLTELDVTRLFLRRYVIASSVALAPLTALTLRSLIAEKRANAVVAVLVFAFAAGTLLPHRNHRVNEDWRGAMSAINQRSAQEPLIFYSGLIEADPWWDSPDARLRAYCEFPLRSLYPLAPQRSIQLMPRTLAQKPMQLKTNSAQLLIRSSEAKQPHIVEAVLRSLGPDWRTDEKARYGKLCLFQLHRRP